LGLERDQYTGKGFERVQIKGRGVRDFVPVHREARKVLDDWLDARADEAKPTFITRTGRRLSRREAAASIQRIATQANGGYP
jgi:site-specific recombinase XerC